MQGYQVTFFTQQDRMHGSRTLAEWLMKQAHDLGIRGATMTASTSGFGHDGKQHSSQFFDLSDQPVEITMALSDDETERLFGALEAEKVKVFFVKSRIEFGMLGDA
jgi:PII-like signaling protein